MFVIIIINKSKSLNGYSKNQISVTVEVFLYINVILYNIMSKFTNIFTTESIGVFRLFGNCFEIMTSIYEKNIFARIVIT